MAAEVEIRVLCDNHGEGDLQAEHGLAFWIETPEQTLLYFFKMEGLEITSIK